MALLPVHAALFWALTQAPAQHLETVYGTLYPPLTWLRSWLDVTPLSPALTVGLGLVIGLGLAARRGQGSPWPRFAWRLLVLAAALAHLFPLAWGLNYLRPSAPERLGLQLSSDPVAFLVTSRKVVEATNAARIEWVEPDPAELDRSVDLAVLDLLAELGLDEAAYPRRIRFLPRGVMLMGGWHGVTIPHTTEAWVDPAVDPRDLPHVIAHEKIHQAGFARESDASFLAWLALTRSEDPRLRYSSLFFVLDLFAHSAPTATAATPLVQQDQQQAAANAEQVQVEAVVETTHQVYDAYLKANTVEAGVSDYDHVAQAIHAWLQAHPDWLDR